MFTRSFGNDETLNFLTIT